MEPNGVPDDRRRELVARERDRHAAIIDTKRRIRLRCRDTALGRGILETSRSLNAERDFS
jgi:hypothetical protein